MSGEFGDGDDRRANLGTRYDEVQSFINHIYEASANDLAYEVISGKYGNGNTVDNLVRLNGIGNPNLIYAGTKIRVK